MPDGNGNAFTSCDAPTIARLIDLINADRGLSDRQRQDMGSALTCLARWLSLPAESIPANLGYLRRKLERINPVAVGVSPRRFENVRSLVMKAFRHAGLDAVKASYLCPLTPAWTDLYDRLRTSYERWGLSRFMRFCSGQGIAPDAVDQAVFDRFSTALAEESLVKHPWADHQTACRLWNRMRSAVHGWPDVEIAIPHRDRSYGVAWDVCEPALVAEVQAYLDHLAGKDPLAARCLPRPLAPRSIKAVEGDLQRFIGALSGSGVDTSRIGSLRDLVALDLVERGLRWLWERNGRAFNTMIGAIAWTLRCVAVKHVGVDDAAAARFTEIVERTRTDRRGLSTKNRKLLEQLDDRSIALALVRTPSALWQTADSESAAGRMAKAALQAQIAVAIEILLFAPLRLTNLAGLDLDRHLSWIETRAGEQLQITIPAEEVKNRERLTYLLPVRTTQRIRIYIKAWRPLLAAPTSSALFSGRSDGHKNISCLRLQISRAVERHVGIAMSPHQFRHAAAKLLLDAHPGLYEVVRKMLGHKSVSTTYEHYAGGETKAALALYNEVILDLIEPEPAEPKRKRRAAGAGRNDNPARPVQRPQRPSQGARNR